MSGITNQSLASRTPKPSPQPQHESQTIQTINISNSTVTINGNCQTMAAEHTHVATPAPKPVKDNGGVCEMFVSVFSQLRDDYNEVSTLIFNGNSILPNNEIDLDPINIQYNVTILPTTQYSFNVVDQQSNPVLSGGLLNFLYDPNGGGGRFGNWVFILNPSNGNINNTFNIPDINILVTFLDGSNKPISNLGGTFNPTAGSAVLLFASQINDYINGNPPYAVSDNSSLTMLVYFQQNSTPPPPMTNVYTFTNNSPFPVTVTCQNGFTLTLAANGGYGTGTQIINADDNSNPLASQDTIKWTFTGTAYSCTSQMQLNTTNNGLGNVFTVGNANEISTAINYMGVPLAADIYGNFAASQASMNLPAGLNTNYTYDIVFGLNPSTPCVYTLNVTNNTSNVMVFNSATTGQAIVGTFTTQITVPGYESLTTYLYWPKLTQWGGPSQIIIQADQDGNGTISSIDRGTFDTDQGVTYEPKMVATVSVAGQFFQPNPFTQNSNGNGTKWNTYTNTLPPTGGVISLVFTDS